LQKKDYDDNMKLFLIDKGELKEINKTVFSTGDTYLIDDEKTIYVWIGSKCSVDEKTSGAAQARRLDQERGGAAKIVTVDQGQEPESFLKLVAPMGAMKIVERNVARTMLKDVVTGDFAQFAEHKNVLYRVSSEEFEDINAMKMIQVPYSKNSLDSEDCFVLDLGTKIYIWQGRACSVKERVKAGQWARQFDADRAGAQNEVIFEEGDDSSFIEALDKGEDYKESDAVQLRAESELEPETEADIAAKEIQPELKVEIEEAEEEGPKVVAIEEPYEDEIEIKPPAAKIKTSADSAAAPGIPGRRDDSILTIEKPEGRRMCPKCNNDQKNMIHESVDKGNIIVDYPRMYGK
jgi:hypothetical protein